MQTCFIQLGAKRQNSELLFLIKFAGSEQIEEVPAAQANVNWPQAIIMFYEQRLEWITSVHFGQPVPLVESNNIAETNRPESVLCMLYLFHIFYFYFLIFLFFIFSFVYFRSVDATMVNGELLLWMQYAPTSNNDAPCKFILAKEANKKCPELVIQYYERQLSFN